jgi:4-amino-4-deoxy-L-arabinose transferase-like glycosyltransferase
MGREGRATPGPAPLARAHDGSRGVRIAWAAAPVAIVATAALLRFVNLGDRELFRDEAASWLLSSYPLGGMLDHARFEAYPPLYAVALQLWTGLFGDGEAALRTLSAIAGVATVVVVWAWGRESLGRVPACIALGLAALSVMLIEDARDARMYAIETAFATASWWLTWRLAILPPRRAPWRSLLPTASALVVVAAGELWTLAFGIPTAALQVLFAGSVAVVSVVSRRRGRAVADEGGAGDQAAAGPWWAPLPRGPVLAVAAIAVGASTFLAWLPALLAVAGNGQPFWTGRPNIDAIPQTFDRVIGVPWSATEVAQYVAWALAVAGVVGLLGLGVRRARSGVAVADEVDRDRRSRLRWLGLALLMAMTLCPIVWLYSQVRPIYDARYFGSIAPPLCLVIAAGVPAMTRLLRNRLIPAALLLVLVATMASSSLDFVRSRSGSADLDPAQETMARLVTLTRPGDVVLTNDARTYFLIDYYLHRAGGEQAYGLRVYDWSGPSQPFFYGTYLISSDRVVTPALVDRVGWAGALPDLRAGGSIWLIAVTAGNRDDMGFAPTATGQLVEESRQLVRRPGDGSGKAGQIRQLAIP